MHTHPTRYNFEAYKEWRIAEDERQRQALEAFNRREARPGITPTARQAVWWFAKLIFWSAVIWAIVAGALAL